MSRTHAPLLARLESESGTTLIETLVATAILLILMAGLLGMAAMATSITENQGHLSARATEDAVDKMEQLLDLTYGDAQSDTTVFPSATTGGTGLALGGGVDPLTPIVGYTDYLDANGNILCTVPSPCGIAPPAGWYYKRQWQITSPAANLKQITVMTIVKSAVAGAMVSKATVSALKTNCLTGC